MKWRHAIVHVSTAVLTGAVFVVPSRPVLVSRRVYAMSRTLNGALLCRLANSAVAISVTRVFYWSNASVNYHLAARDAGLMYVFCLFLLAVSEQEYFVSC